MHLQSSQRTGAQVGPRQLTEARPQKADGPAPRQEEASQGDVFTASPCGSREGVSNAQAIACPPLPPIFVFLPESQNHAALGCLKTEPREVCGAPTQNSLRTNRGCVAMLLGPDTVSTTVSPGDSQSGIPRPAAAMPRLGTREKPGCSGHRPTEPETWGLRCPCFGNHQLTGPFQKGSGALLQN